MGNMVSYYWYPSVVVEPTKISLSIEPTKTSQLDTDNTVVVEPTKISLSIEPTKISQLDTEDIEYLQSQKMDHISLEYTKMLKSKPQQKKKSRPTRKSC